MSGVWAFVDAPTGVLTGSNVTLIKAARALARDMGAAAACVHFGKEPESALFQLREFGPEKIYWARDAKLDPYRPYAFARTLAEAVKAGQPDVVLFTGSLFSKEVAARTAQHLHCGLMADVTGWKVGNGRPQFLKTNFGGKYVVSAEAVTSPVMVYYAGAAPEAGPPAATTESIEVKVPAVDLWETLIEIKKAQKKSVRLEEAAIIVGGGRGLGKPEGFDLIRDFAQTVGGEVAATRAVVDLGWIAYEHQVGQTGKTVRPKLYFACGISGSVQHRAGMQNSDVIVAVNKDPNAPIFQIADYGIVGDLYRVLPVLLEKFKERHLAVKV